MNILSFVHSRWLSILPNTSFRPWTMINFKEHKINHTVFVFKHCSFTSLLSPSSSISSLVFSTPRLSSKGSSSSANSSRYSRSALQRLGFYDVPKESFKIKIIADDLDVLNDKKITSETVNNENSSS